MPLIDRCRLRTAVCSAFDSGRRKGFHEGGLVATCQFDGIANPDWFSLRRDNGNFGVKIILLKC
ncbi:MAG: hypothetical protein BA868_07815 [Desulfobacterales bacterium C00003106]|nr:MAG: hypothetical protein BA868_07815 [Desulfobacterales bacterium C00003106]